MLNPDLTIVFVQLFDGWWHFHCAYPSDAPAPIKYPKEYEVFAVRGDRFFAKPDGKRKFVELDIQDQIYALQDGGVG